jgi:hypothetical protein
VYPDVLGHAMTFPWVGGPFVRVGGGGAAVVVGGAVVGSVAAAVVVSPNPPPVAVAGDVATIVLLLEPPVARIATSAPSAARTRKSSTGQIQSPGYHRRLRQGATKFSNHPASVVSLSPHSRQYSWPAA